MLKYPLLFLLISTYSLSTSEPAGNYDDLQVLLQSFMDSYTGSPYSMSTCLTPQIQSRLDQQLSSTYGYLLTMDFEGLLNTYEDFLYTLMMGCELCGLNQVQASLKEGLNQKGQFWFEVNFWYHGKAVLSLLDQFGKKFKAGDWQGAGKALGSLTNILVPFEQTMLAGGLLAFDQSGYQTWWKGFVNGLSLNSRRYGTCAVFMLNFANSTIPTATDFSKFFDRDLTAFSTFFGDLAGTLTFFKQSNPKTCNFELLESNLGALFSADGAKDLVSRYIGNIAYCHSAYLKIQSCDQNIYGCGQGFGTLVKYLLAWGIN